MDIAANRGDEPQRPCQARDIRLIRQLGNLRRALSSPENDGRTGGFANSLMLNGCEVSGGDDIGLKI
jgi:hypothetical protein